MSNLLGQKDDTRIPSATDQESLKRTFETFVRLFFPYFLEDFLLCYDQNVQCFKRGKINKRSAALYVCHF